MAEINGSQRAWVSEVNDALVEYNSNLSQNRQRQALSNILKISSLGNKLIQVWQPWVKVKKQETKFEADSCVMLAGNGCRTTLFLSINPKSLKTKFSMLFSMLFSTKK